MHKRSDLPLRAPEPARATAPERLRVAIAIPAYGRAEAMAVSLAGMAAEALEAGLSIGFYVSDDTPDASVEDALTPLIEAGLPILYRHNTPSLGHDRNLIAAMTWPDADYVWLMGNRLRARSGLLQPIVSFLAGQDLVFLNVHADYQDDVRIVRGRESCLLLCEMLWHQTLTGATLYSYAVCQWVREQGDRLLIVRNFPQICVMMGFASARDASIGWFRQTSIEGADDQDGSYWLSKAIDVFGRDWSRAVSSFPAIVSERDRRRITRQHSAKTNLFNTARLIQLRETGQFSWASMRDPGVRNAMHLPVWKLLMILVLPAALLRTGGSSLAWAKRLFAR